MAEFEADQAGRRRWLAEEEVKFADNERAEAERGGNGLRDLQLAEDWMHRAEFAVARGLREFTFCVEKAVKYGADRGEAADWLRSHGELGVAALLDGSDLPGYTSPDGARDFLASLEIQFHRSTGDRRAQLGRNLAHEWVRYARSVRENQPDVYPYALEKSVEYGASRLGAAILLSGAGFHSVAALVLRTEPDLSKRVRYRTRAIAELSQTGSRYRAGDLFDQHIAWGARRLDAIREVAQYGGHGEAAIQYANAASSPGRTAGEANELWARALQHAVGDERTRPPEYIERRVIDEVVERAPASVTVPFARRPGNADLMAELLGRHARNFPSLYLELARNAFSAARPDDVGAFLTHSLSSGGVPSGLIASVAAMTGATTISNRALEMYVDGRPPTPLYDLVMAVNCFRASQVDSAVLFVERARRSGASRLAIGRTLREIQAPLDAAALIEEVASERRKDFELWLEAAHCRFQAHDADGAFADLQNAHAAGAPEQRLVDVAADLGLSDRARGWRATLAAIGDARIQFVRAAVANHRSGEPLSRDANLLRCVDVGMDPVPVFAVALAGNEAYEALHSVHPRRREDPDFVAAADTAMYVAANRDGLQMHFITAAKLYFVGGDVEQARAAATEASRRGLEIEPGDHWVFEQIELSTDVELTNVAVGLSVS